jgi:hypothetical protein
MKRHTLNITRSSGKKVFIRKEWSFFIWNINYYLPAKLVFFFVKTGKINNFRMNSNALSPWIYSHKSRINYYFCANKK